jgi:hypothetical protein
MYMNKVALESYLRNLLGQVIAAVMIVMQTSNAATPLDFGQSEWLLVANALWGSLIPTAIRWANKKDPAFGRFAALAAAEVSKKLATKPVKSVKKK